MDRRDNWSNGLPSKENPGRVSKGFPNLIPPKDIVSDTLWFEGDSGFDRGSDLESITDAFITFEGPEGLILNEPLKVRGSQCVSTWDRWGRFWVASGLEVTSGALFRQVTPITWGRGGHRSNASKAIGSTSIGF